MTLSINLLNGVLIGNNMKYKIKYHRNDKTNSDSTFYFKDINCN